KPEKHSAVYWAFSDSFTLIKRNLTHIFNNLDQLMSMVIQPIMFMLLFRYVFGGAINTGGTSYVNFLVAGILVQSAAFGATTTALGVATDLQRGIIDRFRSLPMLSSAVLIGHTVADLFRNAVSSFIMVMVALLVGFRPTANVAEWILAIGILLLFTLAISWLSAILGLVAKSIEAVQWFSFIAIFPLTFASSAFVPTAGMPGPLRAFAENQPITHVIEAIRALLVGTPIGNHGILALVWCVGILVVSIPLSAYLFRRYSSR
ncbi:MAG: superfamily binding cassette transporter rane protein Drug Exporter (DrugE1) Family, partial [Patescibacteria group bacterium]|nr:superfamily binding cassette transporter rane protein Drug Exporter (DrugE1) Family [Patescibacteria group bacterium]